MTIPYPWQQHHWSNLQQQILANKFPHALLICGQSGLGMLSFANAIALSLLCSQPDSEGRPCGRCQPCQLCASDSHPDLYRVNRDEDKRQILVDQIRALCEFMALSRQFERYKIGLICEAEKLNNNAANSLLKTLEEPPPYSLIIMVSHGLMQIPPTLRSRCQQILFFSPPRDSGANWLAKQLPDCNSKLLISLAHGAPLMAKDLASGDQLQARQSAFNVLLQLLAGEVSATAAAKRLEKLDIRLLLDWLMSWAIDVIRLRFEADANRLDNPDLYQELIGISSQMGLSYFFDVMDEMIQFKRFLDASLNHQLLLEDILLAWSMGWQKI